MTAGVREVRLPVAEGPRCGDVRLVEIGRHRIGLYRVGNELHALADRCPHRGAPLCSAGEVVTAIESSGGSIELGAALALARCPWHKWDFDIATGRCVVDSRLRVRRYAVRIEGSEIVVSLEQP